MAVPGEGSERRRRRASQRETINWLRGSRGRRSRETGNKENARRRNKRASGGDPYRKFISSARLDRDGKSASVCCRMSHCRPATHELYSRPVASALLLSFLSRSLTETALPLALRLAGCPPSAGDHDNDGDHAGGDPPRNAKRRPPVSPRVFEHASRRWNVETSATEPEEEMQAYILVSWREPTALQHLERLTVYNRVQCLYIGCPSLNTGLHQRPPRSIPFDLALASLAPLALLYARTFRALRSPINRPGRRQRFSAGQVNRTWGPPRVPLRPSPPFSLPRSRPALARGVVSTRGTRVYGYGHRAATSSPRPRPAAW